MSRYAWRTLIEKDQLFAEVTLDEDEFVLSTGVSATTIAPRPDLVIYLQAPTDVLNARVRQRGINYEQSISSEYFNSLNDAYMRFFHYYDSAPLLMVNAPN